MSIKRLTVLAGGCALASFLAVQAHASPMYFVANLTPLNSSGVTAKFELTLNGNLLTVDETATGLEPNEVHVQHIHGILPPNQASTMVATAADDTNGDGYVDLLEGQKSYGPILLQLSSPPGGALADFPTAPTGTINFSQTYDLTNPADFGTPYNEADLMPLTDREIVIHGLTVGPNYRYSGGAAADPGEGTTHYVATLPVADGMIMAANSSFQPVPEPRSLALLLVGALGCIVVVSYRKVSI